MSSKNNTKVKPSEEMDLNDIDPDAVNSISDLRLMKCRCNKFIPKTGDFDNKNCQCGLKFAHHVAEVKENWVQNNYDDSIEWNQMKHTVDDGLTDAFGTIQFEHENEIKSNKSQFVRLSHLTEISKVMDLLFSDTCWNIKYPGILISVTGGAELSIQPRLKKILTKGIINATKETDALIITGGSFNGCMKLVGDAVERYNSLCDPDEKIPLIGIADWCCIVGNSSLKANLNGENRYVISNFKTEKDTAYLDPNHSHLLLVDNASHKFRGEIKFRSDVESAISKGDNKHYKYSSVKIPIIVLVIGGGVGTITTVWESIERGVPCIFIKSTGRACDLFIELLEQSVKLKINQSIKDLSKDKNLTESFIKSKIEEKFPKAKDSNSMNEYYDKVNYILDIKNRHLLTIANLENEKDIYEAIIRASLKSIDKNEKNSKNYDVQMNLALKYNCIEIVRDEILTDELRGQFNEENLMLNAIKKNKFDFVQLFLENSFSLKFLTYRKLLKLYNDIILKDISLVSIYKQIYKDFDRSIMTFSDVGSIISILNDELFIHEFKKAGYRNISNDFISRLFQEDTLNERYYKKMIQEQQITKSQFLRKSNHDMAMNEKEKKLTNELDRNCQEPMHELFLLSVLAGRLEMAKIFCLSHKFPLCSALIATKILKRYAKKSLAEEEANRFNQMAVTFENLAYELLDKCFKENERRAEDLIVRPVPLYDNVTCMQVATLASDMLFVSHQCVQRVLDKFWYNKIQPHTTNRKIFLSSMLLPFSPLLMKHQFIKKENNNKSTTNNVNDELNPIATKGPVERSYWNRLKSFYKTPFVQFIYHQIFYLCFLLLFSYVLLCELGPNTNQLNDDDGDDGDGKNGIDKYRFINRTHKNDDDENPNEQPTSFTVPVAEIILIVWTFTYLIDEIMILFTIQRKGIYDKLKAYLNGFWNLIDLFALTFFIVGMSLRFLPNEKIYVTARIILCFDIIFWFIKCLYMYTFIKTLGPKLLMILKMSTELAFFLAILVLFLFAFGVSTQALMFTKQELSLKLVKNVFFPSYFVIGGEYYTLEDILTADECATDNKFRDESDDCPDLIGANISSIIYVLYLVFVNILLVNLLIAIFNNTYESMQIEANKIWQFQRYDLVYDYYHKSYLPRPFNSIKYLIDIVMLSSSKTRASTQTKEQKPIVGFHYDLSEPNEVLDKWEKRMTNELF